MNRNIRSQGAIIQADHMLLIKHREPGMGRDYWVIPGGGREDGESEQECVRREMKEETHLDVRVEQLLLDEPGHPGGVDQRLKTYLCSVVAGEALSLINRNERRVCWVNWLISGSHDYWHSCFIRLKKSLSFRRWAFLGERQNTKTYAFRKKCQAVSIIMKLMASFYRRPDIFARR